MKRREFLQSIAASTLGGSALASAPRALPRHHRRGSAEHCIMIWLGGGMAQMDTFDPKRLGNAPSKKAGSYYPAIETSVPGVKVCEHLRQTADLMHHVTAVRTVHHDVVDEHVAATNRMHTGRTTTGTVQYPSLGSIVSHQRGPAAEGVPGYVLIGYPNLTRGPGFLGQEAGFVYLTDHEAGPAGLARPAFIGPKRQSRREALLRQVRQSGANRFQRDPAYVEYDKAIEESLRLAGPEFMRVFNVQHEPARLRERYGEGFGQRCLLARRLCEAGVRFVEVSHNMNFRNGTGWDTHNDGQLKQHLLIRELDQALSGLICDLENRGMLDRTLIIINSEFGRPAQFDGGGGRGHHSKCFTVVLAGGGMQHAGAFGESDHLAMQPIENPVSVPNLFATALTSLGIDPAKHLYDGERPVPITDGGKAIEAIVG